MIDMRIALINAPKREHSKRNLQVFVRRTYSTNGSVPMSVTSVVCSSGVGANMPHPTTNKRTFTQLSPLHSHTVVQHIRLFLPLPALDPVADRDCRGETPLMRVFMHHNRVSDTASHGASSHSVRDSMGLSRFHSFLQEYPLVRQFSMIRDSVSYRGVSQISRLKWQGPPHPRFYSRQQCPSWQPSHHFRPHGLALSRMHTMGIKRFIKNPLLT